MGKNNIANFWAVAFAGSWCGKPATHYAQALRQAGYARNQVTLGAWFAAPNNLRASVRYLQHLLNAGSGMPAVPKTLYKAVPPNVRRYIAAQSLHYIWGMPGPNSTGPAYFS
jgi:hypothetical protein